VILDKHPAHRVNTENILKELKAIPLKLPINSSIFNPVEYCWGWMKQKLRKLLLDQDQDSLLQADRKWL
jgi:transposase